MVSHSTFQNAFENDRRALEEFIINNPELDQLENIIGEFNIFEALGVVRQEIRHSDFLAFLLNPNENHGLSDYFLKRFIQKVIISYKGDNPPVSLIDIDFWDLNETSVFREWKNIDIVLENRSHQFIIIIENKIDSGEHSDQLKRYRSIIKQYYRDWVRLYIYLTPEGNIPTDEFYIPINYKIICSLVDDILAKRASIMGEDVKTLLFHYNQMLRRHIVSDSPIADLCRKIYQKHRRAIDLIFEHRPDLQASLREYLEQIIQENSELLLDYCSKTYVRFVHKNWDVPLLQRGDGWTPTKRMLIFEFRNYADRLSLALVIGPGPQEIRQKLFEMAQKTGDILKPSSKTLGASFCTIYTREFLRKKDYDSSSLEDLKPKIKKTWDSFINHDLPKIEKILKSQSWIWVENMP